MITIKLPSQVSYIISTLENNNHHAFAVGGCIRDSLMNKIPEDWDICTSATPEQIIKTFRSHSVLKTGIKHGTVTLILDDNSHFEITTFRNDGTYTDSRRPDSVEFVTDIKEDLSRRDFTINAIGYNRQGIVDFFDGIEDINRKTIKCVGEADKRFQEDALRILRALRFSSVLGFEIEKDTSKAIINNKHLLRNIAVERIMIEFTKTLLGDNVDSVINKYFDIFCEFLIPDGISMFFNHLNISKYPKDINIRLSYLFLETSIHPSILKDLKFDNKTIKTVSELVEYHNKKLLPDKANIKQWLNKIGEERLKQHLFLKPDENISGLLDEIIINKECYSIKMLAITGDDLKNSGIVQGVEIGNRLNYLLDKVINGEVPNNKMDLITCP